MMTTMNGEGIIVSGSTAGALELSSENHSDPTLTSVSWCRTESKSDVPIAKTFIY